MPFIDPTEPYAAAPRLDRVDPTAETNRVDDVDGRYGALRDLRITGELDLADCESLELSGCVLDGVSFAGAGIELEIDRCELHTCDLSGVRIRLARKSLLKDCRLAGTDVSTASLNDVLFDGGAMRYVNLRMSKLNRVAMQNLSLSEVDFYSAALTNVDFSGSSLEQVNIDAAELQAVDLRRATQLGFTVVRSLEGALIREEQAMELVWLLTMSSGVDVERSAL